MFSRAQRQQQRLGLAVVVSLVGLDELAVPVDAGVEAAAIDAVGVNPPAQLPGICPRKWLTDGEWQLIVSAPKPSAMSFSPPRGQLGPEAHHAGQL